MKTAFHLAVIIFILGLPLLAATNDDGWENVSSVTRERSYEFVSRDRHCLTGRIVSATADSVSVKLPNATVIVLNRVDLLQITAGSHFVFSGRSSWSDFSGYKLFSGEGAIITTKAGKKYSSHHVKASNSSVTLGEPGHVVTIQKCDVARVILIFYKPLSDGNEYWLQECGYVALCILNADLWPRLIGIGQTMHVRVYESSLPEDNTPQACKTNP